MLAVFLEDDEVGECRSLKRVICSGEALSYELQQRFFARLPAELHNLYGPTEAAVDATFWRCRPNGARIVPIGKPIANMECYILDSRQNPVPVGWPGELHLGGLGLARDYLNRPELTAEKFIPHPFSSRPGARLYRTGDLCRWLPDGNIEFLGRLDFQVKIRGFRIELGEIEAALDAHPAILQSVVMARSDGSGSPRLVAYFVPQDGQVPTADGLREFLRTRLPDFMVPAAFVALESMPLTSSGKVDRKALPAVEEQRPDLQIEYVAPRNDTERQLAKIWQDLLHVDRVGIHDNFFDLGGHSLLAIQTVSRINRELDLAIALRELFEAATLDAFAERVEKARQAGSRGNLSPIRPVPRDVPLPLSFGQEALWVISRLEDGRSPYTVFPAARVKGPLNVTALERAFNELLRRHENLRTTFREVDGRPVQVVTPYAPRVLPTVDLSGLPGEEREEQTRHYAWSESRQKMDLSEGPLLRMELITLDDEDHVVLVGMHHIIYDGWSMDVLGRELFLAYQAFAAGLPSPLPELAVQYGDFAAWQRARLQGETLDRLRNYWLSQLKDVPVLELPTDRPRSAVRAMHGGACKRTLPAGLNRAVKQLGREEGATLFMTLLAALQVLLQRYSGQEDFPIGTPVAGRLRPEIEQLIGYFVNTLVLRADLSGDPSFRELLRRVREAALQAFEHQEFPFERLVQELRPARDPSRHPVFQVLFVLQNAPQAALRLSELEVKWMEEQWREAAEDFDLALTAEENAQGTVSLRLDYRTDLFEEATAARMLEQLQTLLESVVADPDHRISEVALLGEGERGRLLAEWSGSDWQHPVGDCVEEWFERQAEQTPEALALIDGLRQWTYRELDTHANQLAHALRKLGVGPEQLVAVRLERSAEWVVAVLAVLKAGGAYLPLDPQLPAERLRFTLEDARVEVLLTQQSLRGDVPAEVRHVVCLDADRAEIAGNPADRPARQAGREQLAYVIYTSGSTGLPKGVMIEHPR